MNTKSKSQDRRLVSSEPHELRYAGNKVGEGGKAAVIGAKQRLGRATSRKRVMEVASAMAGHPLDRDDARTV